MTKTMQYSREEMLNDIIHQEADYFDGTIIDQPENLDDVYENFLSLLNQEKKYEKWKVANKKIKRKLWIEAVNEYYPNLNDEMLKKEHEDVCLHKYEDK